MSGQVTLRVEDREVLGKQVKALRALGQVPGVIYERGQASLHVVSPLNLTTKAYQEAGKHKPVELQHEKETKLAMIKDVDIDPVTRKIRHVAFHAINRNEKVEAEIPLQLTENSPAERAGLTVLHVATTVVAEALPADLPDAIEIDASVLNEVGDQLTVADVVAPKGVTILAEPETVIAVVEAPRSLEAEEAAAAAEAEAAAAAEGEAPEGAGEGEATGSETSSEEA